MNNNRKKLPSGLVVEQYIPDNESDYRRIKELINSEIRITGTFYAEYCLHSDQNNLKEKYFVVKKGNNIIAISGYSQDPEVSDLYWLGWFAVKKEFQRKGIGTFLLKKIIKILSDENVRLLCVHTSSKMPQAIRFYEKNGFVVMGRLRDYFREGEDKIIYSYRLR